MNTEHPFLKLTSLGQKTKLALSLCAILLVALLLRLPSIYGNLPDMYWHDELNFIEGALRIGAGEIKGASFGRYGHGTLTYILLFAVFGLWFAVERLTGLITGLDDFVLNYAADPTQLIVVTHTLMLVASLGSVWLTYMVGKRLFNARTGLIAALLMAVSFQSVHMTYGKEDGLFTFFLLVSFYCAIRVWEQPERLIRYILTGGLLGVAAAVKYFGFVGIVILVVVAWHGNALGRFQAYQGFCAGILAFVVCFACLMPGVILEAGRFVGSLAEIAQANTGTLVAENRHVWSWYGYPWTTYAVSGGLVLTGLFYCGALLSLWEQRAKGLLLLAYPLALTLLLTAAMILSKGVELPYYQLSTIPFLCVAAGKLLDKLAVSLLIPVRWAVPAMVIVAAASNVADDIRFHRMMRTEDSRTVARKWIEAHVPDGASMLIEGSVHSFILEGPQLKENRTALERDMREVLDKRGKGRLLEAKLRVLEDGRLRVPRYDLHRVRDIEAGNLQGANFDYVVVRSERGREVIEGEKHAYRLVYTVQADSPLLFRILPMLSVPDIQRLRDVPLTGAPSFTPGPSIWVYQFERLMALEEVYEQNRTTR